jgi:hypothetical protein
MNRATENRTQSHEHNESREAGGTPGIDGRMSRRLEKRYPPSVCLTLDNPLAPADGFLSTVQSLAGGVMGSKGLFGTTNLKR